MTEKVGGNGVVAVLKNGPGPVVLVRTDMDALPVVEQTGLPYASKVRVKDRDGNEVGVMHACGHDIHMTCWVGTARVLAAMKDKWSGTVVFIGQPAEEIGRRGADDARRRPVQAVPEARLRPGAALRPAQPGRAWSRYAEGLALANVGHGRHHREGQGRATARPRT